MTYRLSICRPFSVLMILSSFWASQAWSDPQKEESRPGTVQVASRLFLVGEVPYQSDTLEDFLPLTEVRWIRDLVNDDPLLARAVLHIERPPSPPAYLLGLDNLRRDYPDQERIPDEFRVEGYVSATSEGEVPTLFQFYPDRPAPDFKVNCGTDPGNLPDNRFLLCVVCASYPLDPDIMLKARLYFPPPFAELHGRFEAIVDRMREIATCLDVTDTPATSPEAQLETILKTNPDLKGCQQPLPS